MIILSKISLFLNGIFSYIKIVKDLVHFFPEKIVTK